MKKYLVIIMQRLTTDAVWNDCWPVLGVWGRGPWRLCMQMNLSVGEWKIVTIAFEILVCSHNVFLLRSTFLLLMKNPSVYPEKVEQSNDCQRQDSVAFAKDSQTKSEVGGKAEGEMVLINMEEIRALNTYEWLKTQSLWRLEQIHFIKCVPLYWYLQNIIEMVF